jgi:hypothetical protein
MTREPRRVRHTHDATRPVTLNVITLDRYEPDAARVVVREALGAPTHEPRRSRCAWVVGRTGR